VADIAFAQAGRLKVIKVDTDAEPALSLLYSIQSAPTFLTFRDSKQLGRLDGAPREASELAQWVQASMS
jgi:thioredoxin 2